MSVTQIGGVLGVPTRFELDSAALSHEDATELRSRSSAVAPTDAPEPSFPGEIGYEVRVEPRDAPAVEATYSDTSMPDDVRRLVTWVQDHPSGKRVIGDG